MLRLEPLLSAEITLARVEDLGETPHGHRRIIPITGGTFTGERLSGKVLPGGADWQLIRSDNVAWLDARYTLETQDGALIYVRNQGYRHAAPAVMKMLMAGKAVDPSLYYMRTTPWFETSEKAYAWMNRIVCVGTGERRKNSVKLDFYEVK